MKSNKMDKKTEQIETARKTGAKSLHIDDIDPACFLKICTISSLEKLSIHDGNFNEISGEISSLENLKHLEIAGGYIHTVSPEIGRLEQLETLRINLTDIREIPESISSLKNLRTLDISHNDIKILPDSIGELTRLKRLYLQTNELETLPESIGSLDRLLVLNLKRNNIGMLPESIGNLTALEILNLEANGLEELPGSLSKLANLTCLNINDNQIRELSDSFDRLHHLAHLQICRNRFKALPETLSRLEKLETIHIDENPLTVEDGLVTEFEILDHYFSKWGNHPFSVKKYHPDETEQQLTPIEKNRIIKPYTKAIDAFKTDREFNDNREIKAIVDFIRGETDVIPRFNRTRYSEFSSVCRIFAPIREWTFVDKRLLSFVTANAWFFDDGDYNGEKGDFAGYFRFFYPRVSSQIKNHPDLFAVLAAELERQGVAEEQFVIQIVLNLSDCILQNKRNITPAGKYLVKRYEAHIDTMMAVTHGRKMRFPLFGLFARYRSKDFYPRIDALLFKGKCAPHAELDYLLGFDQTLFEPLLEKALEMRTSCFACRMKVARLMRDYYGKKYYAQTLEFTKTTLKEVFDRKNAGRYDFPWTDSWSDGTMAFVGWCMKSFNRDIFDFIFELYAAREEITVAEVELISGYFGRDGLDIYLKAFNDRSAFQQSRFLDALLTVLDPFDITRYFEKVWTCLHHCNFKTSLAAARFLAKKGAFILNHALEKAAAADAKEKRAALLVLSCSTKTPAMVDALQKYGTDIKDPEFTAHLDSILEREPVERSRYHIILEPEFKYKTRTDHFYDHVLWKDIDQDIVDFFDTALSDEKIKESGSSSDYIDGKLFELFNILMEAWEETVFETVHDAAFKDLDDDWIIDDMIEYRIDYLWNKIFG